MIKIGAQDEISVEAMFSQLMSRKRTATRFRLPYTAKQVYTMLYAACQVEVANRHREFVATDEYKKHLWDISQWLTSQDSTFGLFLCGEAGNGKTTILRALQNLTNYLRSDESYSSRHDDYPARGYTFITAKDLVLLAKAYNNPTRENESEVYRYKNYAVLRYWRLTNSGASQRKAFTMATSLRRLWILSPFVMRNNSALWCHPTFLLKRLALITMNVLPTVFVK